LRIESYLREQGYTVDDDSSCFNVNGKIFVPYSNYDIEQASRGSILNLILEQRKSLGLETGSIVAFHNLYYTAAPGPDKAFNGSVYILEGKSVEDWRPEELDLYLSFPFSVTELTQIASHITFALHIN
jgi:hypothetical protein